MREAMYYDKLTDQKVECKLCPHACKIMSGHEGICRVRGNRSGILYSFNYGQCTSYGLDAIEKKPLYHFYPGYSVFSVGSYGCNFRCRFCQNWQIAQGNPQTIRLSPEELVSYTRKLQTENPGCIGIAYTYSEPAVWYEFVLDCAKLAQKAGLKNVLVTNGFLQEVPMNELLGYIDAVNLDVKAFQQDFYNRICGGKLPEVLHSAELIKRKKVHLELTMLLIPDLNDNIEEIEGFIDWVAELDPCIPVHFTRYYPNYQMDLPPTPVQTLKMAYELARQKLSYVFIGNVAGGQEQDTFCPDCGEKVIEREYMRVRWTKLKEGRCPKCGKQIPVVGV